MRKDLVKGTPLVTLGFCQEITDSLLAAGVLTLEEMQVLTEFQVCRHLLPPDHGFGMSNELVSEAVNRFAVVRVWMDRHGRRFQGQRRDLNDLWRSF